MASPADVSGLEAALIATGERIIEATRGAAKDAAEEVRTRIMDNLDLSHYPPASEPGTPPAYRSGFLHDSVYVRILGTDAGTEARIYPSTVYARIQELGGLAGRNHASRLPARPYVGPVARDAAGPVRDIFVAAWRDAITGG
jgi:phage gpG-like protein